MPILSGRPLCHFEVFLLLLLSPGVLITLGLRQRLHGVGISYWETLATTTIVGYWGEWWVLVCSEIHFLTYFLDSLLRFAHSPWRVVLFIPACGAVWCCHSRRQPDAMQSIPAVLPPSTKAWFNTRVYLPAAVVWDSPQALLLPDPAGPSAHSSEEIVSYQLALPAIPALLFRTLYLLPALSLVWLMVPGYRPWHNVLSVGCVVVFAALYVPQILLRRNVAGATFHT